MNFVAYAELLILARSLLGAITFRSSFVTPIFLAHFIRLRYHASPFTRSAMDSITVRLDKLAAGHPGAVQNGWTTAKRLLGTWVGGTAAPHPAGAAPAAPAAAPAAAATGANPAAGAGGAGTGAQQRR
jgi:hypothetical protein